MGFQENTRKEETNDGGEKSSLSCSFALSLKNINGVNVFFFFFFSVNVSLTWSFFFAAGCVFFGQFNINKVTSSNACFCCASILGQVVGVFVM